MNYSAVHLLSIYDNKKDYLNIHVFALKSDLIDDDSRLCK